jgi:hypothetical protein
MCGSNGSPIQIFRCYRFPNTPGAVNLNKGISMIKSVATSSFVIALCLVVAANVRGQATTQQPTQPVPKVKVGSAVANKASSPKPSATAKHQSTKSSVGSGKLSVKTSQPSSFWTEEIDLEDDGSAESTDFLYDANRGVLYTYREDDFTCQDGQAGRARMLEAIYTTGNKAGQPAGSGWYAVGLNEGQCGAKAAGDYGCSVDANGDPTACGVATVNYATGEVDIAVVQ